MPRENSSCDCIEFAVHSLLEMGPDYIPTTLSHISKYKVGSSELEAEPRAKPMIYM